MISKICFGLLRCRNAVVKGGPDRGAAMVEYALLIALLAVVAIGAVTLYGNSLSGEFSDINSSYVGAKS